MEHEKLSLLDKPRHSYVNIICIIGLILSFVITQTFDACIVIGTIENFHSNFTEVANKYELEITPEVWTILIWVSVFTFYSGLDYVYE